MNSHDDSRCPHYQIYSESLELNGPPAYLAVRRCLMTERLNRLLCQSDEGRLLADQLVVRFDDGKVFAFVGPDLEAVSQATCSVLRCETRCTPAYMQHLEAFQIEDPSANEITCDEDDTKDGQESRTNAQRASAAPVTSCVR